MKGYCNNLVRGNGKDKVLPGKGIVENPVMMQALGGLLLGLRDGRGRGHTGAHRGHQLELNKPQARSLNSNMSPKSFLFLVISDVGSPGVMMDLKRRSGY